MKIQLLKEILFLFSFYCCFIVNAQENSSIYNAQLSKNQNSYLNKKELELRVSTPDFKEFLSLFYESPIPFNYSISYNEFTRTAPISFDNGKGRSFLIPSKFMQLFLNYSDDDFYGYYYDIDEGSDSKSKKDIYANNAYFLNNNFIVLIYGFSFYNTNDYNSSQKYLCIFTNKGTLVTQQIVKGDSLGIYSYDSFVLLDKSHFKVFRYLLNEENVKTKNDYEIWVEYIDNNQSKTKCIITDYEIGQDGFIRKVSVSNPIYLKEDCWKYTSPHIQLIDDDPILKY